MSYLSDAEKAVLTSDLNEAISTWLRTLTIYQEATQTVVISDPNYNPLEAYNQNSTSIINTPNFSTVSGRILYDKDQEWSYIRPYDGKGIDQGAIKVKGQQVRSVRLKVDYSGYALLQTAKLVQIDGYSFDIESIARPHGLFNTDYYTFYFVRSL